MALESALSVRKCVLDSTSGIACPLSRILGHLYICMNFYQRQVGRSEKCNRQNLIVFPLSRHYLATVETSISTTLEHQRNFTLYYS